MNIKPHLINNIAVSSWMRRLLVRLLGLLQMKQIGHIGLLPRSRRRKQMVTTPRRHSQRCGRSALMRIIPVIPRVL